MDYDKMSGAEIGRQFAPKTIKDREGWGRKLVRKLSDMGMTITEGLRDMGHVSRRQPDVHRDALQNCDATRDYKAPHAYRPTPARPHFPRRNRELRFCNH